MLVIADGLSPEAVNKYAFPVIQKINAALGADYRLAVAFVEQGRVAVADEIGELLDAKLTAIFIGERPGLSSPQSMGIYTTYCPKIGFTDERRNCI